jgi:hypothetical protein
MLQDIPNAPHDYSTFWMIYDFDDDFAVTISVIYEGCLYYCLRILVYLKRSVTAKQIISTLRPVILVTGRGPD